MEQSAKGSLTLSSSTGLTAGLVEGVVVVNKPKGMTSHDVVDQVRKLANLRQVGHAGTLDPSASGVLVVLIGRQATKLSDQLRGQDKEYLISMEFGKQTNSGDEEGRVVHEWTKGDPRLNSLHKGRLLGVLASLCGEVELAVPMFSAIKVGGVKLYEMARGTKAVPAGFVIPKRKTTIHQLDLLDFVPGTDSGYPSARLRALVSSGTYTRSIVQEIGRKLNIPTNQTALIRTRSGEYTLEQAIELDQI